MVSGLSLSLSHFELIFVRNIKYGGLVYSFACKYPTF